MPRLLRAAAAQFATSTDLAANLATTVRMLSAAATEGAELVVLPEFCNHLSIYDDAEHAWRVAVELDGDFVGEVRATARRHGVWAQCNVTLRRRAADGPDGRPVITVSNLVIDATGELVLVNDKTVLMGAEGDHLTPANAAPGVVASPWGTLGSYSCMDGVVPEVPRVVAAHGARVLMNSLNSFALDEAALHVPIRAAENRAWVIACCKVGPLLPPEKAAAFSEMMGVPAEMLNGAGESRIVAPDGTVVATGPRSGEAVVTVELDLDRAGEARPDGTDPWAVRRPELFGALALPTPPLDDHARADVLEIATLSPAAGSPVEPERITDLVRQGVRLIVLPELAVGLADLGAIAAAIAAGSSAEDTVVVTSVRDGDAHVGVVVDRDGVGPASRSSTQWTGTPGRHDSAMASRRSSCPGAGWRWSSAMTSSTLRSPGSRRSPRPTCWRSRCAPRSPGRPSSRSSNAPPRTGSAWSRPRHRTRPDGRRSLTCHRTSRCGRRRASAPSTGPSTSRT